MKEQKNLKVILELKDNLPQQDRSDVIAYIEKWKSKFEIEQLDDITYCKIGNNPNYSDDAGNVGFFYARLGWKKEYFKKLELIKIQSEEKYVAV